MQEPLNCFEQMAAPLSKYRAFSVGWGSTTFRGDHIPLKGTVLVLEYLINSGYCGYFLTTHLPLERANLQDPKKERSL